MNVGELIELLQTFDPERVVIMQRDSEGNGYAPLLGADDNARWNSARGELGLERISELDRKQGYTEEDIVDGEPAVVVWPSW